MGRKFIDCREYPSEMNCETAEHPFGSIKQWMNQGAFLMRGLENVRAELSLTALVHNLRRALNILGGEQARTRGCYAWRRPAPSSRAATAVSCCGDRYSGASVIPAISRGAGIDDRPGNSLGQNFQRETAYPIAQAGHDDDATSRIGGERGRNHLGPLGAEVTRRLGD
jgi:Transposase DDE domain